MKILTKQKLKSHLKDELGLKPDSIVFLFSALWGLGKLESGFNTITESFEETLPQGLFIIPTFSYSWSSGKEWDKFSSDCPEMGNYPNSVYHLPDFVRTDNPNFSVAMKKTSQNQQLISGLYDVGRDCFGEKSIFAKLYHYSLSNKNKVFVILMGGAFNDCLFRCTFFHYVQQKIGIPYRYLKKFPNPKNVNDEPVLQYSRYLSLDEYRSINNNSIPNFQLPAEEDFTEFGKEALSEGILKVCDLNYYPTRMMEVANLCNFFERNILENPFRYLKK